VELEDTEALFYLAKERISQYKFFDALDLIATYEQRAERTKPVEEIEHLKESTKRAIKKVRAPVAVTIQNLGTTVNTNLHDYAPVWDSEAQKLYFTSRRRFDNKSEKDISEQYDENIYTVDLKSENLDVDAAPQPLNSRRNDAAVACAPNGQSLIIFRTDKDGFAGDLFFSKKDGYSWKKLERLDDEVNSKYQEASASFGNNDGTVLYFSSDRPGGFGGKDIYRVTKLPDGEWGEAENMGETINTMYDEDAPFVSTDGSLYFASEGHTTMGGYDIFCSTAKGDGWNTPAGLGFPINTPGDDIFFNIDSTGKMAYFSSERVGGMGLQDIYKVIFDEATTIIYKGQLVDAGSKINQQANITLLNNENGEVEGMYQTDPNDGEFVLALNTNKEYTVLVEAEGYEPLEKSIFFGAEIDGAKEVEEELSLFK
jgi:hypothetical protein